MALVVIGIPVGIRVLIHSFTPGFHEYEAAFFYFLSDIPLAIVSVYGYYCFFRMRHPRSLFAFLFVFLLFALASLLFALDTLLAFYGFFRLFLAVGFALTIRDLFFRIEDRTMLYGLILFLAFSESVLAFLQFRFQGNVGLGFLGESPIVALIPGTAKSILSDARVVRAYGTFLHPNILGAFLLLGLGVLMYFWFSVKIPRLVFTVKNYGKLFKKYLPVMLKTMLFSAILFVILVGITVTFSRTAWVLSLLLVCFFGIYFLFFKKYWRQAAKLLVTVAVSVYFLLTVFSPFIAQRAKV